SRRCSKTAARDIPSLPEFSSALHLQRADRVLAAIKLDDQLRISTNKVDNEAIDGYLSLEFPAREPATTQPEPEDSLCIRLLPTQSFRCRRVVGHLRTITQS